MHPSARFKFILLMLTALIGAGIFGLAYNGEAKTADKVVQKKTKQLVFDEKKYEQGLSGIFVRAPGTKTIYWIAPLRRVYFVPNPGKIILKSWYGDKIPDIYNISKDLLNKYFVVGPLSPRAGTYLLKFGDHPAVFAVEPKGMLRPIKDEAAASRFYGPEWDKKIINLNPEIKKDFQIGETLEYDSFPPEGTLVRKTGDENIYSAKWGHLVLLTRKQWQECGFAPEWVIEGNWNYPESKPYRETYGESNMLGCDLWSQIPKMITARNKLAQKDRLRVLNAEFIENTGDEKHIEFFKAFNSQERRPSIYDVKDWYLEQYKRYGKNLTMDFDVAGPFKLPFTYEGFLRQGKQPHFLQDDLKAITEDLLKKADIEPGFYDMINLIFFDSRNDLIGITAHAGSGHTWISAYSLTTISYINSTIAHEMAHLLGAYDLQQGGFDCYLPNGLADPYQRPLYPQKYSTIMCNERFIDLKKTTRDSDDLSNAILGESVIRNFGWK